MSFIVSLLLSWCIFSFVSRQITPLTGKIGQHWKVSVVKTKKKKETKKEKQRGKQKDNKIWDWGARLAKAPIPQTKSDTRSFPDSSPSLSASFCLSLLSFLNPLPPNTVWDWKSISSAAWVNAMSAYVTVSASSLHNAHTLPWGHSFLLSKPFSFSAMLRARVPTAR